MRVVRQRELHATEKWGLAWRAPAAFRQARREAGRRHLVPLSEWATIRRGFTTGANDFFYLDPGVVVTWGIEPHFRQPLLKSLRNVDGLTVTTAACEQEVLLIPPTATVAGTAAAHYIAWGEQQGVAHRSTCSRRHPWYMLPIQEPAPLVLPKGIWGRHLAPVLADEVLVDQQLYQIQLAPGVNRLAAAALLNSSWAALQMELLGRVNFGEGVLWLAGYEVERLLLPDPRYLSAAENDELAGLFRAAAAQPPPSGRRNGPPERELDRRGPCGLNVLRRRNPGPTPARARRARSQQPGLARSGRGQMAWRENARRVRVEAIYPLVRRKESCRAALLPPVDACGIILSQKTSKATSAGV